MAKESYNKDAISLPFEIQQAIGTKAEIIIIPDGQKIKITALSPNIKNILKNIETVLESIEIIFEEDESNEFILLSGSQYQKLLENYPLPSNATQSNELFYVSSDKVESEITSKDNKQMDKSSDEKQDDPLSIHYKGLKGKNDSLETAITIQKADHFQINEDLKIKKFPLNEPRSDNNPKSSGEAQLIINLRNILPNEFTPAIRKIVGEYLSNVILDKTYYNNILDTLDLLRIKDILENLNRSQEGPDEDYSFMARLANKENSPEIYRDTTDKGLIRSHYIQNFISISNNISSLSKHKMGIKTLFASFPWERLEEASSLLISALKEGDIQKFEAHKALINSDFIELRERISLMTKTVKLIRPEVNKLLEPKNISISDKQTILEKIFSDLEIEERQKSTTKNSAFTPANPKHSGLFHIRKMIEPVLDQEAVVKFLKLIDAAENSNPNHQEGRTALLGITLMVGENTKNISDQTKSINANEIQFKNLKEFRDNVHDFLDRTDNAKRLFEYLNSGPDKTFEELKKCLTIDLRSKLNNLLIPTIEESKPFDSENPLPPINYKEINNTAEINQVLRIISQAIPKNHRDNKPTEIKLEVCADLLLGKLPLPVKLQNKDGLINFLDHLFKEELESSQRFLYFLNKNHDQAKKDRKKMLEDIKSLNSFDQNYKQIDNTVELNQILEIISQVISKNHRDDKAVKTKLKVCADLLSGKSPLSVNLQDKGGLINFLDHLFKEELASSRKFLYSLNRNHDQAETDRKKVSDDIKLLSSFVQNENYGYLANELNTKTEASNNVINCLKQFENEVQFYKMPISTTSGTREEIYVREQLDILMNSLESINQATRSVINSAGNYQDIRKSCSKSEFHYFHLFHLIVIGQCIQNLSGKEFFLQNASSELLTEFEFLKWVRNGLMHNQAIDETGSMFIYFNNDLLKLHINEHGARTYDSDQYLQYITPLIQAMKEKISISSMNQNLSREEQSSQDQYYYNLILKELESAHKNKDHEAEKLILLALGYDPETYQDYEASWDYGHQIAEEILQQSNSLNLEYIYLKKEQILKLEEKYKIKILSLGGKIIQLGSVYDKLVIIFVKNENSHIDLALFKQELSALLSYKLTVITEEHLREYYHTKCASDVEDKIKLYYANAQDFEFNKILNTVELTIAIKNNASVEEIKYLLENRGEFNLNITYTGYTVAQLVAYQPHTKNQKILKLLIEHGIDVNIRDKRGDTLAHYAAEKNDVKLLKLLYINGADFSITNRGGRTALDITNEYHSFQKKAYKFLLKYTESNIVDKIVSAIKHQDLKNLTKHLASIKDKPDILNTETEKHGLIGHVACGIGNMKIIKLLEEYGCNLALIAEDGSNALEKACYGDNADLNKQDRIPLITYLIDKLNIEITSEAIHNAIYCADLRIPRLLLDKGADPDSVDVMSPLLVLISQPDISNKIIKAIKLLLEYGADILQNEGHVGNSLHLAAERGHLKVVELLLDHANRTGELEKLLQPSPNECWVCRGMNPYEVAVKYDNTKIVEILYPYCDNRSGRIEETIVKTQVSLCVPYPSDFDITGDLPPANDNPCLAPRELLGEP